MKYFLSCFVVILFSLSAFASEAVRKESVAVQGKERVVYLFVPDGVGASKPAPLIILLHGSGRNGLSLVEKWTDLAKRERALIAGPDAKDPRGWLIPDDGPEFLRVLVESLKSRYAIDARAVYLFGHSAGAIFALQIACLESEYFAAAAIHAGALAPRDYTVADLAKRKIPVAIFVGTKDHLFSRETVRATRDLFSRKGFPVELTEIPDHDHWYYDLAPKINAAAWEFLKRYRVDQPRYQEYRLGK